MGEFSVDVGDILAGKYRVERIIGRGGMGVVVSAFHLELEQRVALKFLLPEYAQNKEAAERFRREARAAVKIRSEHVARVTDVGTLDGGAPYMVMEYLRGRDMACELEQSGPLAVETAVEYVFQACLAMAEAHAKGLVHRDLKPANLFLTKRADGSTLVKVLDFGISKSLDGTAPQLSLTRTRAMVGSPLYMSPEQLESAKDVDVRSDVWSLGVILFELLTGALPFNGETLPQLVRQVMQGEHPSVSDLRPEVDRGLSDVVDRCLELELEARISDVGELANLLEPHCPGGGEYSRRVQRVLHHSALRHESSPPDATGPTMPMEAVSIDVALLSESSPDQESDAVAATAALDAPPLIPKMADDRSTGDGLGTQSRAGVPPGTLSAWQQTASGGGPRRMGTMAALVAMVVVGGALLGWQMLAEPETEGSPIDPLANISSSAALGAAIQPIAPVTSPALAPAEPATSMGASEEAHEAANDEPTPAANVSGAGSMDGVTDELQAEPSAQPSEAASAESGSAAAAPARAVARPSPRPKPSPAKQAPSQERSDGPRKTDYGFTDFGGRR